MGATDPRNAASAAPRQRNAASAAPRQRGGGSDEMVAFGEEEPYNAVKLLTSSPCRRTGQTFLNPAIHRSPGT
jgi:hypothetical protein